MSVWSPAELVIAHHRDLANTPVLRTAGGIVLTVNPRMRGFTPN